MTSCRSCARGIPPDGRFCPSCGAPAHSEARREHGQLQCTHCGTPIQPFQRFCSGCGNALGVLVDWRHAVVAQTGSPVYLGFWIRLGAYLIDFALWAVGAGIIERVASLAPTSLLSFVFIPFAIYGVYKHLKCQTLGRRMLGLEVVNQAGEEVDFWRGALRETIGKFVSAIFFLLGFLWVAFDRDKQGWHDKIAGTYVVRSKWRPRPVKADSI